MVLPKSLVHLSVSLMMANRHDSKSSATLKNILDDLLSNNTNEKIKVILSQQEETVEETVGNTLEQKYVE